MKIKKICSEKFKIDQNVQMKISNLKAKNYNMYLNETKIKIQIKLDKVENLANQRRSK